MLIPKVLFDDDALVVASILVPPLFETTKEFVVNPMRSRLKVKCISISMSSLEELKQKLYRDVNGLYAPNMTARRGECYA
jgi:hypothetical protein